MIWRTVKMLEADTSDHAPGVWPIWAIELASLNVLKYRPAVVKAPDKMRMNLSLTLKYETLKP